MEVQKVISENGQLPEVEAGNKLSASLTETCAIGSYLESWFLCLKSSKEYTQNCRTGIFPTEKSYETYRLFGSVEFFSFNEWWQKWGFEHFRSGLTSVSVRQIVQHKSMDGYAITVDVFPSTSVELAGSEFALVVEQMRKLSNSNGLLSSAPMAWAIYRSRISAESIRLHLDVLHAYESIIRNSPSTKLWCIGEQLHLNPKAMTHRGDTPKEQVEKHKAMGQTVSNFVQKGRVLVLNACNGLFPKFTRSATSTFRTLSKK